MYNAETLSFIQAFPKFTDYLHYIMDLKNGIYNADITNIANILTTKDIIGTLRIHPDQNQELKKLKKQFKNRSQTSALLCKRLVANGFDILLTTRSYKLFDYSLLKYAVMGLSIPNVSCFLERCLSLNDCIFCCGFNILDFFVIISYDYAKQCIKYKYNDLHLERINIVKMLIDFNKKAYNIFNKNNHICKIDNKNYNENCLKIIYYSIQCADYELLELFMCHGGVIVPFSPKNKPLFYECNLLNNPLLFEENCNEKYTFLDDIIEVINKHENNNILLPNLIKNYMEMCKLLFQNEMEVKFRNTKIIIANKEIQTFLLDSIIIKETNVPDSLLTIIKVYLL
jgi:hypothetical protein